MPFLRTAYNPYGYFDSSAQGRLCDGHKSRWGELGGNRLNAVEIRGLPRTAPIQLNRWEMQTAAIVSDKGKMVRLSGPEPDIHHCELFYKLYQKIR
jgi:hypothetical protein